MTPEKIHEVCLRRDRVRAAFANYSDGTGHDAKLLAEDVSALLDGDHPPPKAAAVCVIGLYCERHHGTHGQEAEELRAGIETILADDLPQNKMRLQLRRLIDGIDARDSLGFLEAGDELEALRDVFAIVNEWKRHVDAQPAAPVFPSGSVGDRLATAIDRVRDIACTEADFACAIPGCLHHAHPDCPCGHSPDVTGPCAGCNCCDPAP